MLKNFGKRAFPILLIAALVSSLMDFVGIIPRNTVYAAAGNSFVEAENCTLLGSAALYSDTYASGGKGIAYIDILCK